MLVGGKYRERYWLWVLVGLSLGVACLFKSFALVAPAGLALTWSVLVARRYQRLAFLRFDVPRILLASFVALACFAIWPALDPEPAEILQHFVLEENVGKLGGDGYLRGLFFGPYPLHRLWLGHLANAGLFALPLVYLVVVSVRDRARMSVDEKSLWILVLSFLVVYSVPGQRQENYLLPSVPALAVLMAMRWRHIGSRWFHFFNLPAIVALVLLIPLLIAIRDDVLPSESYPSWQLALPVLALVGWIAVTVRPSVARATASMRSCSRCFLPYRVRSLRSKVRPAASSRHGWKRYEDGKSSCPRASSVDTSAIGSFCRARG